MVLVGRWVVVLQNGTVTYPEGSGRDQDSIDALYQAYGMSWDSAADLIEYHLTGKVTDTSIAAKHAERDARRADKKARFDEKKHKTSLKKGKKAFRPKSKTRKAKPGTAFVMDAAEVDAICNFNMK